MGASKGGKARASVLTPEEPKEIAKKAIRTRWAKTKGIPLEDVGQVSTSMDPPFHLCLWEDVSYLTVWSFHISKDDSRHIPHIQFSLLDQPNTGL